MGAVRAPYRWDCNMRYTETDGTTYNFVLNFWVEGATLAIRKALAESKALDQCKNMRTAPRNTVVVSSSERVGSPFTRT